MNRFDREFHQSDFERFKLCPRMLYYLEILGIEAEKTSEFALAGSAMHETCLKAHTEKLWEETMLFDYWREDFEKRVASVLWSGAEVERDTIDQMITGRC